MVSWKQFNKYFNYEKKKINKPIWVVPTYQYRYSLIFRLVGLGASGFTIT